MIKEKYTALKQKLSFLKWIDPFTYIEILLRKVYPKKSNPSFSDEAIDSVVYVVSALVFAFLLYSILAFFLNTSSPMVIVSSASMVPEMYRGDIIVLYGANEILAKEIDFNGTIKDKMYFEFGKTFPEPIIWISSNQIKISSAKEIQLGETRIPVTKDGDIIVYFSEYSGKEIIHRAVAKINASDGTFFLTKGDANPSIDQECFPVKDIYGQTNYLACITKNAIPEKEITGKAILKIPLLGCVKLWVFDNIPFLLSNGSLPQDFYGVC
ncbi:MAG: hypothetical protein COT90_05240 [Candidatus Diapherotrites archaeon CG10_big_fil_rev_8_21_14_0_10_31_34]|nr:MAG: hypothetical protein COT90_05240 [Candidatus Diapherotrites archaeon CG10_big_fil_rev_8_21_14_0_10_31_34]